VSIPGWTFEYPAIDRVIARADLDERHHTPFGVVHGGVYAWAVESACSAGASAAVADQGMFAVGVNNSTDFLRTAVSERVELVAFPVFQGRTQQLWQAEIARERDGKLVARGQLRLQNLPLGGRRQP